MTYYVRPGVKVDKVKSDERQVTLKALTIESTGRYRCEVSTEAPSFATVSSYNDMYVVGKLKYKSQYKNTFHVDNFQPIIMALLIRITSFSVFQI